MKLFCALGFVLITIIGCLLHFVYSWSGEKKWAAVFAAVNESVWEHLKIALMPMFVWAFIGIWVINVNNYALGVFVAFMTIMIFIPTFFYSYTAITKRAILIVDIISFVIAIALSTLFAALIFNTGQVAPVWDILAIIGSVILGICFAILSFFPPHWIVFKDPITGKYGLEGHSHSHEHKKHDHK